MADINRRQFLKQAAAAGVIAISPHVFANVSPPVGKNDDRILVVVELSGGNDGLNSVVPFRDDAYYRLRPTIGIKRDKLLTMDDDWGLNPGMLGFKRLWDSGELAVIHGCGYDDPSFSHFTSMAYWHTAAPNSGNEYGWMGRLADEMTSTPAVNPIINIGSTQSLAVNSRKHTPVVFDDPARFQRSGFATSTDMLAHIEMQETAAASRNPARRFLNNVAKSANTSSALVQEAWQSYQSPIDYGIFPMDLNKVAACIDHGLPTQLYHVAFRNNAFDTHVQQPALHTRLLSYACDAIHGFVRDLQRLGQGERVSVLVYSEFGRRVPENANLGTDHGTANVMFVTGGGVKGGHYGKPPSLTDLTEGENLKHTVDFRSVYATAISGWLGQDAASVLNGNFDVLPIYQL